jgi:hypothetical protein
MYATLPSTLNAAQILRLNMLEESVQFNFQFDIRWMLNQWVILSSRFLAFFVCVVARWISQPDPADVFKPHVRSGHAWL